MPYAIKRTNGHLSYLLCVVVVDDDDDEKKDDKKIIQLIHTLLTLSI